MATVTYIDLEEAAPVVEVMGATFITEEPQEVSDAIAFLVSGNPFFVVDGDKPKARGTQAPKDQPEG